LPPLPEGTDEKREERETVKVDEDIRHRRTLKMTPSHEFLSGHWELVSEDPCGLNHECNPGKNAKERSNRHELQNVRSDQKYAEKRPVQINLDMVAAALNAETPQCSQKTWRTTFVPQYKDRDIKQGDEIIARSRPKNFLIATSNAHLKFRSVAKWTNRSVSMKAVPEEYRTLRDALYIFSTTSLNFTSIILRPHPGNNSRLCKNPLNNSSSAIFFRLYRRLARTVYTV
ncbi:hypothetical protein COOONC_00378, partial [Cooperia oncophora]